MLKIVKCPCRVATFPTLSGFRPRFIISLSSVDGLLAPSLLLPRQSHRLHSAAGLAEGWAQGRAGTAECPFPCVPSPYTDSGVRAWWSLGSKRTEGEAAGSLGAWLQNLYYIPSAIFFWPKQIMKSAQIQGMVSRLSFLKEQTATITLKMSVCIGIGGIPGH